jgi:hypothetical protein
MAAGTTTVTAVKKEAQSKKQTSGMFPPDRRVASKEARRFRASFSFKQVCTKGRNCEAVQKLGPRSEGIGTGL